MKVVAEAPSNIALIKYMGKSDFQSNIPLNASLSITVPYLKTLVEIEQTSSDASLADTWQLLDGYYPMHLSEKGKEKYLRFFNKLKNIFEISGSFLVRSANTFPSDAGLASSASSFAALTLAAWELCRTQHGNARALKLLNSDESHVNKELAKISRQGSGSSCRSFFSPFCLWSGEEVSPVNLPYENFYHLVLLLEEEKKAVSSTEAHQRINSSSRFKGRKERAEARLDKLLGSFTNEDWQQSRQLVWDEFVDMHELFETSQPPFSFRTSESFAVLDKLQSLYVSDGDGPLVTMDAGPNIHLFFNDTQCELYKSYVQRFASYRILSSHET